MSKGKKHRDEPRTTTTSERNDPRQVIGRFLDANKAAESATTVSELNGHEPDRASKPAVAVFCHEPPDSYIGGHVAATVTALAKRGRNVHLFSRHPFVTDQSRVTVHVVGGADEGDVVEQVQDFNRRASNAFFQAMPVSEPACVLGFEWTTAPVLSLLRGLRNQPGVLSLHSLERQRSDLSSDLSRRISEIEAEALQSATTLFIQEPATVEVARYWVPSCVDRIVHAHTLFPVSRFESNLDPGAIKARYQVGPIDPVLLYVGDLDERYGPDLLVKAMPPILRHHPQARLVIVGDGHLFWPLRVYARYLLLEHAVRLVGDVRGQPLDELIQAANVIVVPSRESTPWWPVQAGWAARKPVVATHEAARSLTEHEKDSVLIYPSENSVVWGVERVLYDEELRKSIGEAGRRKIEDRFGWNALAEQLEEVLNASLTR
jgi:glycosyltransferase involved in cell wall biosynthesis